MSGSTRYSLDFHSDCPTCGVSSAHFPEIGVWVCPYCGRCAIEYNDTADGPVLDYLPGGDDPVDSSKILDEFSSHEELKSMLGTPYASKDDLLSLPRESMNRRWNPDRSAWTVDWSPLAGCPVPAARHVTVTSSSRSFSTSDPTTLRSTTTTDGQWDRGSERGGDAGGADPSEQPMSTQPPRKKMTATGHRLTTSFERRTLTLRKTVVGAKARALSGTPPTVSG